MNTDPVYVTIHKKNCQNVKSVGLFCTNPLLKAISLGCTIKYHKKEKYKNECNNLENNKIDQKDFFSEAKIVKKS